MDIRRRSVQVELLDAPEGEGRVRALVTTFDRAYGIGPRTTETIGRSTFADGPVPIYFQHGHGEVPVGDAMATAGERGTELDVQFYLDTERGLATYRAMKSGALKEWSVGFTADNEDIVVTRAADGAVNEHIDRGDLLEVSVVLRGANPNTETLEVRAEAATTGDGPKARMAHGMTARTLRSALESALEGVYGDYVWVADYTDSWVVFEAGDLCFQQDYTVSGVDVSLTGAPVAVVTQVSYVPITRADADAVPATAAAELLARMGESHIRDIVRNLVH